MGQWPGGQTSLSILNAVSSSKTDATFGDSRRRRTDTAMVNEVLCKLLCHNLTCLIHEQETLGIVPVFWNDVETEVEPEGERMILRIDRPR
jgi:hypothetical protein